MKNFKNLKIWQKGMELVKKTYQLAKMPPPVEKYGLGIQLTKSAISVPSNIAEGSAKSSKKDYSRYLEISLGSAYELETQVLITELIGMGDKDLIESLLCDIDEEQKMLQSFIRTVESS